MDGLRHLPGLALATALFVAGGLAAGYVLNRPAADAPADEARIARGKYLAYTIGMCGFCHTPPAAGSDMPDWGRFFSGGRRFDGWWGTTYSGNLTPDHGTGIGRWSAPQFVAAVREGRAPGGRRLLMPHPWQVYHGMARSDAEAIFAYLRTLRPVVSQRAGNRPAVSGEEFERLAGRPASDRGPERPPADGPALGRYLADIVAGCSFCHSPHGISPDSYMAGGFLFELPGGRRVSSPNITSDPRIGIGAWSDEEVARAVRSGVGRDGRTLSHVMPRYVGMLDSDFAALLAYLRSVPPAVARAQGIGAESLPADLPVDGGPPERSLVE